MKIQRKLSDTGRSMIEMLGVLVIIGVLSVAGIAGYTKAMSLYRINKFTETYNTLLNQAHMISERMDYGKTYDGTFHTHLFAIYDTLPSGWSYNSNRSYINDGYGTRIAFLSTPSHFFLLLAFDYDRSRQDSCISALKIAQANRDFITNTTIQKQTVDDSGKTQFVSLSSALYGSATCTAKNKCLKDLTIANMTSICTSCDSTYCRFYIYWNK